MKKRVLITGVTGFAGSHLLDLLVSKAKYELYGIIRERSSLERIDHNVHSLSLISCDLVNSGSVFNIIKEIKPDYIYHLAGESSVKLSWGGPFSSVNNNIVATLNILEALRSVDDKEAKILLACSSEEYGLVSEEDIPIKEETPLKPASPYAVTKVAVDMFGFQYYSSYGIKVIRTRAFNHTGPRRDEVYALSSFAKQIAEVEKGIKENKIYVGNLSAIRDYTDVRDVVRGYKLAMEHCEPGDVYNLCSSKGYKIGNLLEILIGLSKLHIEIVQNEERFRPVDLPIIVGDNSKFVKITLWKPQVSIEHTLQDLLNYWHKQLRTADR
ncbi:MAG TPA: SDR family oxidoreductase [bacterium]|nr:SDR family oxidoreductase [bacterium]